MGPVPRVHHPRQLESKTTIYQRKEREKGVYRKPRLPRNITENLIIRRILILTALEQRPDGRTVQARRQRPRRCDIDVHGFTVYLNFPATRILPTKKRGYRQNEKGGNAEDSSLCMGTISDRRLSFSRDRDAGATRMEDTVFRGIKLNA